MENGTIRTAQDVRNDFLKKGVSMASWARDNGVSKATLCQVLNGDNAATRGHGHKIAVLLGLKQGEIV